MEMKFNICQQYEQHGSKRKSWQYVNFLQISNKVLILLALTEYINKIL